MATACYGHNGVSLYLGDCREVLPGLDLVDTVITDPPYGIGFMGRGWDKGAPGPEFWSAIKDAAKPGATLLAFGGTRTFHRLACAIEDAGWKLRDCIMWLYGSGMPKSLDVSMAIDKSKGKKRKVVGTKLGLPDYSLTDGLPGGVAMKGNVDGSLRNGAAECAITAPATKEAAMWQGWGTALKPAWEPIIVAMKPLDGTFAANAKKHGVAGFNIDGARIETTENLGGGAYAKHGSERHDGTENWRYKHGGAGEYQQPTGRWPANVVLDEEAGELLDAQSNTGGASRFFYCAKAPKKERGSYNKHPTVKPLALMRYLCKLTKTPTGGTVLDPFAGSGSTLIAALQEGRFAVGVEKDEQAWSTAKRRLEDHLKGKTP